MNNIISILIRIETKLTSLMKYLNIDLKNDSKYTLLKEDDFNYILLSYASISVKEIEELMCFFNINKYNVKVFIKNNYQYTIKK